jgi:cytochrome b6-f complex iron-sulfur subunit
MNQNKNKHTLKNDGETTNRRDFLAKFWKILGIVALAEAAFFTVSMLRPGKKELKDSSLLLKVAGSVDDFQKNTVTPDRVNKYFLIRAEDGGFLALSIICSHLGCSVLWDDPKKQFICPCHSSAFDKMGNVINSPAPRALDYYPVIIEEGKVKIDLSQKKKRKKFDKTQVTYAI